MKRVKTTIGNIAEIINGATPSTARADYYGGDISWLTPNDLSEQKTKYISSGTRNITREGLASCSSNLVPAGTVLLTSRAPIGLLSIAQSELCTNQGFKSLVPKEQSIDSEYLYYYLLLQADNLNRIGAKTTFKEITRDDVAAFPIEIPEDITDQQRLIHLLSVIDSKIDLNNKINSELEAMAKTIYDYWFVQFDFPDENHKPYKSSGGKMVWNEELKRDIPEGWEVKKISDLLPVLTGKQDANFATENGKYNFFTCGEEILKCPTYEFEGKSVLIAGNGNFGIKLYEGKFNAYQRTYVLIPNNEKYYTIIYMASRDRISALTRGSRGSIVKFITKGDLEDIQIILPKDDNLDLFTQLNTATKKIEKNLEENQKLAELRDWLLPMLMNGQVSVK